MSGGVGECFGGNAVSGDLNCGGKVQRGWAGDFDLQRASSVPAKRCGLQADGFEVETQYVKIPTPWYQVPPLDFISDNFLLTRVKDQHDIMIPMRPRVVSPSNELLDRGNALRSEAQLGQ